jgi:deoxycytidylate deaminase
VVSAAAGRSELDQDHVAGPVSPIVTTGYNWTPEGLPNCDEGGCIRCAYRDAFGSGERYDKCICVHAEANAIATAARYGITLEGATVYCPHQPCFSCSKELLQAGLAKVFYIEEWPTMQPVVPDSDSLPDVTDNYLRLQGALTRGEGRSQTTRGERHLSDACDVTVALMYLAQRWPRRG